MGIKQYRFIFLKELVRQFSIRKDFYTPANICPVSVDGHNFLMTQVYKNYNSFMILLQLLIDLIRTAFWSMISSISTVSNRTGCYL